VTRVSICPQVMTSRPEVIQCGWHSWRSTFRRSYFSQVIRQPSLQTWLYKNQNCPSQILWSSWKMDRICLEWCENLLIWIISKSGSSKIEHNSILNAPLSLQSACILLYFLCILHTTIWENTIQAMRYFRMIIYAKMDLEFSISNTDFLRNFRYCYMIPRDWNTTRHWNLGKSFIFTRMVTWKSFTAFICCETFRSEKDSVVCN
jgi:hypothetical protein